jgi:hypothetical protein
MFLSLMNKYRKQFTRCIYAVGYPILSVYIKIKVTGAVQYDYCLK